MSIDAGPGLPLWEADVSGRDLTIRQNCPPGTGARPKASHSGLGPWPPSRPHSHHSSWQHMLFARQVAPQRQSREGGDPTCPGPLALWKGARAGHRQERDTGGTATDKSQ